MFRIAGIVLSCVWLAACAQRPTFEIPPVQAVPGPLPTEFGGYWERDYSRGADANTELRMLYRGIGPNGSRYPAGQGPSMSARQFGVLSAMAEFADEITRHDVLTIVQDDREIVVQRKDDYSITCSFHGGVANPVDSDYGDEVCVWDAAELVSTLVLPDGLLVRHRFTKSADGERLRVTTTVASQESRTPFTLQRFYRRYVPPASEFNCIETLSMKRVCSTGEIAQ
ncbi:MAG: hypothetical protein AAFX10_13620 [Pseudomonadota bacterium]